MDTSVFMDALKNYAPVCNYSDTLQIVMKINMDQSNGFHLSTKLGADFMNDEFHQRCDCENSTLQNNELAMMNISSKYARPEDFDFLRVVGRGNFGLVFLVKHLSDNKHYALKVLDKKVISKKGEEKHVMNERNILIKNHCQPFVTSLHYSFETKEKLFLTMEYISGGELFYYIQNHRSHIEKNAEFYAAEIAIAMGYLHSKEIIYRDLKPENILLDCEGHIVITDFGLCTVGVPVTEGLSHSFCGTREYLAPEVITKKKYDKSVDWWSFGAVLYEILCGIPPFYTKNIKKLYSSIVKKPLKIKANMGDNAKNILNGLLEKNPKYRLGSSSRDVKDIQEHVYFKSINWDDLYNKRIIPPFQPSSILKNIELNRCMNTNSFFKELILSSNDNYHVDENFVKTLSGFSYTAPDHPI